MSRFCKLLIMISAFAVTGCAPLGNIGGEVNYDAMWTVPYRTVYDVNDLFIRSEDLSVLASYHGTVQSIPVNKVTISVIEDPDWDDFETPIPPDENYRMWEEGRKVIVVRHGKLSARYSIKVFDPLGIGGDNGGGGEGGRPGKPGVGLEWPSIIRFDSNGDGVVPSQAVPPGGTAKKPDDPDRPGFTFAGWYKDAALTIPFVDDDFDTPIPANQDITLYAKWDPTP